MRERPARKSMRVDLPAFGGPIRIIREEIRALLARRDAERVACISISMALAKFSIFDIYLYY
jgi:hypothetical protein